jgi:hypothetical protein
MNFSRLFKGVLALGCLLTAQSAFAGHFLYTGGHEIDPDRMDMLGFSFSYLPGDDAAYEAAFSGELGSFDAIVIGESQPGISPTTASAIRAYVNRGGRLVVVNNHMGSTDITNQIMGYAVLDSYGCESEENVSSTLQSAAATGTAFVSGATSLRNLSCTAALVRTSLPTGAKSVYSGTGTSQVFTSKYGSGQFAWLGWDYCCGSSSYENDWYHVLAAAVSPSFKVCNGAGYAGAKLVFCQQICEVNQTPTTRNSLLKVYTTLYHERPSCAVELPLVSNNPS